jgi:hypothetical protein
MRIESHSTIGSVASLPLEGRDRGWGAIGTRTDFRTTPTPNPSPQGGGGRFGVRGEF